LNDNGLDGAGFIVHSSGGDYQRDYQLIFKPPDINNSTCLETDTPYSRSRWNSNISIEIEDGRHLQTQRIVSDDKLSLVSRSGCYGLFMRQFEPSGTRLFFAEESHIDKSYSTGQDVNFISRSGTHIGSDGNPSGYDYTVMYGTVDSGVKVTQEFASRISTSRVGFSVVYHDELS
jgi:hypothetical protein